MCAGVPQGSILEPLLFLVYINDLSNDICSTAKLFADNTYLSSVVYDVNESMAHLNNDMKKISKWVYQWKMSFSLNISKQTPEQAFFQALFYNQ